MKKNSKRARLQSLDSAQLAQVAGGVNTEEYYSMLVDWVEATGEQEPGSLLTHFYAGAIKGATSP